MCKEEAAVVEQAAVGAVQRGGRLWRHADFLKLWSGQTVSLFGTLIGQFALPLVAIYTLQAGPVAVALLGAANVAPALVLGLFAGVWVDRVRRRRLMIVTDLVRMAALLTVPLAAALGLLSIVQLAVVAMISSGLSFLFEVAYRSYLPTLLAQEELVEGNSKLAATASIAEFTGFGLAGVIVQAFGAPLGVLVDALTFGLSALSLALIGRREELPIADEAVTPGGVWQEIVEGLRTIRERPVLRAIVGATATDTCFIYIFVAVLMLFLTRELGLGPALLGFIFGIGGISAFVGSLFAERLVARWGLGRSYIGAFLVYRLTTYFTPLAGGPLVFQIAALSAAQCFDAAHTVQAIAQTSMIQSAVPERLLGRVYASLRTIEQGAMLLGLLVGGLLGQWIGLRPTLIVGITGGLLALPWLWWSPIRGMRGHGPHPGAAAPPLS